MQVTERVVVRSDEHGRPELSYAVDKFYGGETQQIINGDLLDGPNSKGSIQAAVDLGAIVIIGNHEWDFLAAATEMDELIRFDYAASLWPRVHDRVLESYGVYPAVPSPANARRLYEKLPESHRSLLRSAPLLLETDDYLVIHGGVTAEPWESQRQKLENRHELRTEDNRYFVDGSYIPEQIQDITLVDDESLAISGLNKLLINGHFHIPFSNFDGRWAAGGRRIHLATEKTANFALVWESWSGRLRRIATDGTSIDYNEPYNQSNKHVATSGN